MLYHFIEQMEYLQIFYYETSELDQVAWQDGSYWFLIPNTLKKTLTLTVFNQQQKIWLMKKIFNWRNWWFNFFSAKTFWRVYVIMGLLVRLVGTFILRNIVRLPRNVMSFWLFMFIRFQLLQFKSRPVVIRYLNQNKSIADCRRSMRWRGPSGWRQ